MTATYIAVRFRQEDFDFIRLRVRAFGAARPGESALRRISCYVSGVFCPFRHLIAWLEASATGVPECAFEWDAEGPEGRLAWRGDRLTLEWNSARDGGALTLQADRRQVVGAFYRAFRQLVESRDYDPLRYERVRNGEALSLLSGGYSEAELIGQLLVSRRAQAEARLEDIWPSVGMESGSGWIDSPWDDWDVEARRKYLKEVFDMVGMGAYGAPIRAIRSEIVERWIGPVTTNRELQSPDQLPR